MPRPQDNALWEEFRRHCDAVFQRSSQEWAAHGAALEANQAQATGLCEELERIAGLTGEPLLAAVKQLDELRNQFDSLDLPRASARELRQRFRQAADRCTEAMRRHREAAARRGWSDLFAAAAQVRAYALATVQGRPADDCEALRASAASAVAGLEYAPKVMRAILEQQLDKVASGIGQRRPRRQRSGPAAAVHPRRTDRPTRRRRRKTCQLRREYQMQRLVASMGRGERATPADLDDLALEWLAVGPVEPAVHDALFARFERCR